MGHEQQVRATWAALSRGDFETVEAQFAPDAKWRAVEDGEWNCDDRTQILRVMRENRARRVLEWEVEEVLDVGERVVVAFRPAHQDPDGGGWPLDNGIRYMVLSLDNGLVTEMKGCLNRQVALDYAETAEARGLRTLPGPRPGGRPSNTGTCSAGESVVAIASRPALSAITMRSYLAVYADPTAPGRVTNAWTQRRQPGRRGS